MRRAVLGDLKLLDIQAATLFELTEAGRLRHVNSPNRSPAPRMWMGGSRNGNIVRIRADVGDETADAIEAFVEREPPLIEAHGLPVHTNEYTELLGTEAPVEEVTSGMTFAFPASLEYEHDAPVVRSCTPEGARLLARLQLQGMPEDLVEMRFVDTREFWPPWCVALDEGRIVSVAFTARLSPVGAEVGITTVPGSRGRGFAAAATAAWSSLPSLKGRVLFYSCDADNVSSRRVAARLGLDFIGPSVWIR